MRSRPTLDQKRLNFEFKRRNPDLDFYEDRGKRYRDNAKIVSDNASTLVEKSLFGLFGPDFIGSLAFAIDPLEPFKNSQGLINEASRYREFESNTYTRRIDADRREWSVSTIEIDNPNPVSPYVIPGPIEPTEIDAENVDFLGPSFSRDTTNVSREGMPFGEWQMILPKIDIEANLPLVYRRSSREALVDERLWTDTHVQLSLRNLGNMLTPNGPLFVSSLEDTAMEMLEQHLYDDLATALSDRAFSTAREFAELKDAPQTVRSLKRLFEFIRILLSKGRHVNFEELGSFIGDQFLGFEFGIKPTYQAFLGLLKLPERAAKKLNFLIHNSGNSVASRVTRRTRAYTPLGSPPVFRYQLPDWLVVDSEETSHWIDGERRMVVDRTLAFPKAVVPVLSDTNYLKVLGLKPTVQDFYNLMPWTWLIDWFSDLGSYVSIMETIYSDRQLINYGFYSLVGYEEVLHTFNLKLNPDHFEYSLWSEEQRNRVFPVTYVFKRDFHFRWSLSKFDGVKTFGGLPSSSTGLSEFQTQILTALFLKYSK